MPENQEECVENALSRTQGIELKLSLSNRHSPCLYVFTTNIQAKLATSISPSFENSQLKSRSPFAHLPATAVEAHFLVFSGESSCWYKEI